MILPGLLLQVWPTSEVSLVQDTEKINGNFYKLHLVIIFFIQLTIGKNKGVARTLAKLSTSKGDN